MKNLRVNNFSFEGKISWQAIGKFSGFSIFKLFHIFFNYETANPINSFSLGNSLTRRWKIFRNFPTTSREVYWTFWSAFISIHNKVIFPAKNFHPLHAFWNSAVNDTTKRIKLIKGWTSHQFYIFIMPGRYSLLCYVITSRAFRKKFLASLGALPDDGEIWSVQKVKNRSADNNWQKKDGSIRDKSVEKFSQTRKTF